MEWTRPFIGHLKPLCLYIMTRMSKSKSQIWSWLKEIIKLLFIAFGCFISITHWNYKLPWIIPNTPLIVSRLFGLFIMGHRGSDSKREMNKLCRSDLTLNFGLLKPYFQNHLVPKLSLSTPQCVQSKPQGIKSISNPNKAILKL